ncbi:hypothetical protein H072_6853 [Dactylellina haptotyla CBS 200.50]|uniref:Glutamine amidotransferase domain-containing protein n=1 Tax=Dactylellina haptotyla (strain CBS 200.50) TaxID=1284197 RepID=S8A941_DACHA|nr:hypothetical protein H072_6853 [Dactylellina haptotyla CBS 200.50]
MAPNPFKLAVLECDQPLDAARKSLGGHAGVWTALFAEAAKSLSIPTDSITTIRYNAEEALPTSDAVDGILISGSRYNAWEDIPWINSLVEFTKECIAKKIPVIGICFGHQIVGRALGSLVNRNEAGWEVAPTVLSLHDKGKEIFGKDTITLHLMNRDIVRECPNGFQVLAYTPKTEIHSLYKAGEVFTVQGHPEFRPEITGELLKMRNESKIIPDDTYADALQRLDDQHDGVLVTKAFVKFLGVV